MKKKSIKSGFQEQYQNHYKQEIGGIKVDKQKHDALRKEISERMSTATFSEVVINSVIGVEDAMVNKVKRYDCRNVLSTTQLDEDIREYLNFLVENTTSDNFENTLFDLNFTYKMKIIDAGLYLEVFSKDPIKSIKRYLASRGHKTINDSLINDPDWEVRREIAKWGVESQLDLLVYDIDWRVRDVIAKSGKSKYLDILVKDKDIDVRRSVAKFGHNSHILELINDKEWSVKKDIICHQDAKYRELLKEDKDPYVIKWLKRME